MLGAWPQAGNMGTYSVGIIFPYSLLRASELKYEGQVGKGGDKYTHRRLNDNPTIQDSFCA